MQALSDMRRDSDDKSYLRAFVIASTIIIYESLSDIYYILPPLLGVAFVLADEAYREKNKNMLIVLLLFLLLFEASKGFFFLSSVVFFYISFVFVLPMLRSIIVCKKCFIPIFIIYAYFGFYLFSQFFGAIFKFDPPNFSMILLYYALIEILFLSILL